MTYFTKEENLRLRKIIIINNKNNVQILYNSAASYNKPYLVLHSSQEVINKTSIQHLAEYKHKAVSPVVAFTTAIGKVQIASLQPRDHAREHEDTRFLEHISFMG